ncbi:bifunctional proline dehydrogenase/L-glutamate gamma-semialdehyde dehydrogenase PutA [Alteromonas sp. 5E99-2]|uniref:bifunctional proline dehydrogenase/L-glutamate gamma-semialdehyde dehydrogenase PutA n=1 Tax=Alteromonas sp. 5E99-2 TaxID=2817683 RepID=UPI001A98D179|nr:bifunctional proline dehydrogenase/L-glutamate gamma-semialdehyde dehydrogenase PutA [Alteromonas sp. 5E99-2]MBO1256624.1 bifunctional proline dehydrogenase/L-glutamate gamma-semialdehyde dehydrogenase PutA [Alteromonas sp. 5E99-2]
MFANKSLFHSNPLRQKIRDFYRLDETAAVNFILADAEVNPRARSRAWERARTMVLRIRRDQEAHGGVDALLNEYSLSTSEGVVLMCLAEALLRVPDKFTQDELIRDKLSQGNWSAHLGNSDSLFVNASSWGLLFTGSMTRYSDKRKKDQFNLLKKTIGRLGEPVIRRAMTIAMRVMGRQFVMGENIADALFRAKEKEQQGYVYSYDMLGEGARTMLDAERYYNSYMDAIEAIGKAANGKGPRLSPGISVKLSAIHPRYEHTHITRVMQELPERLKALCLKAREYNIGLTVDAEEADRLDMSLDVIEMVFRDPELKGWDGFGLAVQAYQKRAIHVIEWLHWLAKDVGRKMMVRLVKGAYWDSEIKLTQQTGVDNFSVFTRKSSTDVSYHACANRLLAYRDTIYPQFATHNAYTAAVIIELAGNDKQGFEFQCLHGMGDSLYDQVVSEENIQCRVYAPVGVHEDLLAYLVRRLLENGANTSFVNAIVDDEQHVEALLEDPVEKTQHQRQHANTKIKVSSELYSPERINSKGIDITDINEMNQLSQALLNCHENYRLSLENVPAHGHAVRSPADSSDIVGYNIYADEKAMLEALDLVDKGFSSWSAWPTSKRAALLKRFADALERHTPELMSLCMREAGKVTQDSIDEIRETVDFCRYYAARAEELADDDRLCPRGVVLAISPWNFPLAIFLGQVVASLVTGNTVLAKPAEQTSLIAKRAVEILRSNGLPEDALQLIIAPGKGVGELLLPDERIKAVIFTGSTQVGSLISQTLAQRGAEQVPLIAETGGQNCMIVDSTALPEQVVDDIIHSGFQSAGQRCSALRVLYLQEDIADQVKAMLIGAMKELSIGDPMLLETDVGPVIDNKALDALTTHQAYMKKKGTLLYQNTLPKDAGKGSFFPPTLYEISDINVLEKEVFGPVVHIVQFKAGDINQVINEINGSGYGLTMGIHTRIEDRANLLAKRSRAGNVYINRNMIGAIVGVQPFGGRGLSGTGPKAGGPHYLTRLRMEKATPKPSLITELTSVDGALTGSEKAHEQANELMFRAYKAEDEWRHMALNDRISMVRQLLAKLAQVDIVDELADDLNRTLATSRNQLTAIDKVLKEPVYLPGPTGESNTLMLEPRGTLVCFADREVTFEYWTLSIVTALATGNCVVAVVSDLFFEEAMEFRDKFLSAGGNEGIFQVAKLEHLDSLLMHELLAGVVVDSNTERTARITAMLSHREGAILPVISAEYNDNLVLRMLTEKTISVDTTASGGNTSLMTLEEETG